MSKYATCAPLVRASVAAILGSAALIGFSSQAIAAAAAEADEDEEDVELEEVQVTGTRIQSPNVTSANPITSVTGEEMRALGMVNVADALTQLVPQNVSTYTDFSVGDNRETTLDGADRGQYFIGNTIANLRGLDPAFGSRTLTLVDGRRVVSTSSQADVVDLNIIPSNLLARMDVVTGGASATYGTGAMAGVVNLVLNNKLTGINVDLDYGLNEAGDGGSPHVSISGGMPLFGGRGHMLLGGEWQETEGIYNCAEARSWCADSRTLFSSGTASGTDPLVPVNNYVPGFENTPARFQMANIRYSQFSENGTILVTGQPNATSAYRFTEDGTGVEEYALGYRGGNGTGNVMNGDGPLATTGQSMRSDNKRHSLFGNFEFNFTERTTGSIRVNYAKTEGENRNNYTIGTSCVRFNQPGVAAVPGATVEAGATIVFPGNGVYTGTPWASPNFRTFLGITQAPGAFALPYWQAPLQPGNVQAPMPTFNFNGNAVGTWQLGLFGGNPWWQLISITMTNSFSDPGTPAVLPELGRNSYAFLNNLTPEALEQVQRGAFNAAGNFTSPTAGTAGGLINRIAGDNPCAGNTPIRKVWTPQFRRFSSNESETMGLVTAVKGRFGADWRWDLSYSWGQTETLSTQNNAETRLRQFFATDAVIDDRVGSATFGQPICRVTRDGVPLLDIEGLELSDRDALTALASGCQPLNVFGSTFADADAAAMQRAAIDYAYVENSSAGKTMLQTLGLTANGTMWQGFGAGPMTGAVGVEFREDKVNNPGSLGNYYERFDIVGGWSDRFGGRTRVAEGFTELNLPLVSGVEGVNLLSINGALRYSSINNKGGAGTTGQSLTQETTNWKASALFEPFDWVRLRITRSQDLRAAGYRDLFINQETPGGPDYLVITNPWRERTFQDNENQQERAGTITRGNPLLKPERSNTLTVGMVLSPGGWAQGMRLTADYYNIRVRDGIFVSWRNVDVINSCWEDSGNVAAGVDANGNPDPSLQGINGLFNEESAACQEIIFAEQRDENGNPIAGSRNLQDILRYIQGRPSNNLPFQRRGVDASLTYNFPLSRAFETLPGSMSLTVRSQRALESSGTENLFSFTCPAGEPVPCDGKATYDLVGQIRSSRYIPGVTASPKWTGNIIATYSLGDLTTSLSARYIGGAKMDKMWADSPDQPGYQDAEGRYLSGSVDDNFVEPYMNFSLNGSYNLDVGNLKQFQVFGSVNNLFDKDPPFSGGFLSGVNTGYHDSMGRAYRFGVRMRF